MFLMNSREYIKLYLALHYTMCLLISPLNHCQEKVVKSPKLQACVVHFRVRLTAVGNVKEKPGKILL
jgi:hypothetical protein